VNLFIWAGYWFGNIPLIKNNFGFVTIGIIVVSVLPMVTLLIKQRRESAQER
jgi:membrane-associated protein